MSERFRVGLKTVDRILIEGVIDKNARYVFTHGYCSELAHALHERTDGLVVRWSPYCPTAGSSMKCRHCTRAWVLGEKVARQHHHHFWVEILASHSWGVSGGGAAYMLQQG
jgi:hypothetical protein